MRTEGSIKTTQVQFSPVRVISEKVRLLEASGRDVIRFQIGEPDFDTPKAIKEATAAALEANLTHYTSNRGYPQLRKVIVDQLKEKFDLNYDPEEIMVTCGAAEALFDAMTAFLNPGDELIVPVPAYMNYKNIAALNGAKVVTSRLGADVKMPLDIDDIRSKITSKTKMLVVNNPNNPTGIVLPREALLQLASIAEEYDLLVLTDEIYADIVYGEPLTSFASLPGMFDRTILVSGFSKTYAMTGWRLGYLACPQSLYAPILKVHQYTTTCCPTFLQAGLADGMGSDDCKREVDHMVKTFDERRQYIMEALDGIAPLGYVYPSGAFYIYIDVSGLNMTNMQFAEKLLEEEGVALVPGAGFDEEDTSFVRLSYATSIEHIKEGLDRIRRFCQRELAK